MKFSHRLAAASGVAALLAPGAFAEITYLDAMQLPNGGEIVSFYKNTNTILTTNSAGLSHQVKTYTLGNDGHLIDGANIDFSSVLGGSNTLSLSSVAADPLGRDFGIASLIPTANSTTFGKIALFQLSTGALLNTFDVGYHPDSVSFTPDGSKILVANEGEYKAGETAANAAAGSVSIINISSITAGAAGASALNSSHVTNVNFNSGLASGVSLNGVRLNVTGVNPLDAYKYIEPEYIASTNDKAFVSLQENNSIAVIDLTGANANKVTAIHDMGTITKLIDASDRDGAGNGPRIAINDLVTGMPMPDTIVKFEKGGRTLIATANEGDARTDDGDIITYRDAVSAGLISATTKAELDARYGGDSAANGNLGRLKILLNVGDTNGDGKIDVPTALGTRSFSIIDGETGELVFDSMSMIEEYVAQNHPATFNQNDGNPALWDQRSDDKGPEPEALAYGEIDGRQFIFLGAERENGIFQFDITDLNNVIIAGYYNTSTDGTNGVTSLAPESLQFISAADSPTGEALLIAGYEGTGGNGSVVVFSVNSLSPVPEPSTVALAAGAVGLLCLAAWRRRKSA
jgi:hypothetical protein